MKLTDNYISKIKHLDKDQFFSMLAGIKRKLKHYATRHTHATQLLRATGNLKLVADTLGITIKQASKYSKKQHEDVI